jgi:hypothetical protein
MPFDCQHRQRHGQAACLTTCPAKSVFSVTHVARPGDVPPADARTIDVAVLDMHHGWPNLGHDAIVHAMQNAICDIAAWLAQGGLHVRVLSYDVRRGHMLPELHGGRHALYVGTGGPGHLDPRRNDGVSEGAQGIAEDPAWEAPLFRLFDGIRTADDAALLGVCHTFGVMCRWLGIADAVLRGAEKGGKSSGIVDNVLAGDVTAHPWFSRFADALPDHRRFRVLDNRLYDLIPGPSLATSGVAAIAHETTDAGDAGPGVTMIEVARMADGVMPRILGVNHHPEVVNRPRLLVLLEEKYARGDVSREWYDERKATLTEPVADEWGDRLLHLTSSYTFMGPLRYHLYRQARLRGESLGLAPAVDEAMLPLAYSFQRTAAR